ncbi:3'-5' exonuclease [Schinkia azotoformans]|uniref:3'-5' exonuclease n=1 Tax=Schinkia azotoformans TaxID=1454 RepID=UPI0005522DFE|nr:nuclease-related domain-containing DEAD/DEAH box helicase [Schinkia azotoformans]MEC1698313.1 3'-5' exonuclease [Schinkia azotoformans]MEC1726002.1 3'-5' exonuclease [Schinkia azotoformans]MEC1772736.1 3'-5' exonuclease [Schinkia azotoformans]MEC1782327.1 3'-5' exonuclease [Schinkia azotoformans]MED4331158.1 3'-5' exonuclease [Schinkia azotoformans]
MAYTIPETIRSSATVGERLLFRTFKTYLPDDYIVYYEPEIHGKRPDFVIIGPDLGLLVLEVKDYTKNTLFQINIDEWTINTSSGEQTKTKSPLKQARDNMFHIVDALKKDRNLVHLEGKYQFQLKFPYGFGTVFTRLYQKDFIENGLYSVVEPSLCLTRDEIDPEKEAFSEENLIEKITNMFVVPYRLRTPLSKEEIDAIRYHLFPEVRISAEFKQPVPYQDQLLLSLHDIKAMDLLQENLAKQIGDKNRLIRGVAGSGKTLILASRAKLLVKEHPEWKILILCYNISLSRSIEQMIHHMMQEPDNLFDFDFTKEDADLPSTSRTIKVRNFHAWLKNDLKITEKEIPSIIEKLESGESILPMYDAILIDEGQDFDPEWFQLVSNLLNPETKSLLLVEDRAQDIYKRKRSYLQDTGLSFQGRSKILSINYRNTAQIVKFAWDFYQKNSSLKNKVVTKEFEGEIIAPQSTRRKGVEPAIVKMDSFFKEAKIVAKQINKLHEQYKVPFSEMLILYRVKKTYKMSYIDVLKRSLTEEGIDYYWLTENSESKRNFEKEQETVKISTIESSKGLDFQAVFIVNVDNMPFALEEDKEREASLLYIGMTRAKEFLFLSYSGESEFTEYFDRILDQRKELKKSSEKSG